MVPALAGWYIWLEFLYCIWQELFFEVSGNIFFEKIHGKPFFPQKGGWVLQKVSKAPLFGGKKGLPPILWYQNVPTKFSFGIGW